MQQRLVTPPTEEPISLAEAKAYLRVTHKHEDATIDAQRIAARRICENAVRMSFCEQVWEVSYDLPFYQGDSAFSLFSKIVDPDDINEKALLPNGPVSEIQAVEVYRNGIAPVPVSSSAYLWDRKTAAVQWVGDAFYPYLYQYRNVRLRYKAGIKADEFVKLYPDIVEAIRITLAALYDQRGYSQQGLPPIAWQMLSTYWTSPLNV